uniref:chitinase n=1 Tax=Aegilops tauschii subsp. strangulata TaxID=200361 RepID=A0A453RKM6_AEGTS
LCIDGHQPAPIPLLTSPGDHAARERSPPPTTPSFLSSSFPSSGAGPAAAMGMVRAASFLLLLALLAAADARRQKGGETACDKGWECSGSRFCCNETITDYFKAYQFEELFAKRNSSLAHATGFWDYQAFITAAALFEPRGFGTTGGREMSMKEVAAFLGHVGAKTSCGYSLADGGSLAWGLCYNHEMSPSQSYCDDSNELYRCAEGVEYYGRGTLPVYWELQLWYHG